MIYSRNKLFKQIKLFVKRRKLRLKRQVKQCEALYLKSFVNRYRKYPPKNRDEALQEIDRFPDHIFKSMFRLDRPTFNLVLNEISPLITRNNDMAMRNGKGSAISPKWIMAEIIED